MAVTVAQGLDNQQYVFADIHGKRFANLKNADVNKPLSEKLTDYFNTSFGAFRCLQGIERILKLAAQILKNLGSKLARPLEGLSSKMANAWQFLAIPRLFEVVPKMKKAAKEWFNPPPVLTASTNRKRLEQLHDIADGAATCGYVGSLVTSSQVLKNFADIPDLVSQVTDLTMAKEDWALSLDHLKALDTSDPKTEEIRKRFISKLHNSFFRLLKAVSSVSSAVLGLMALWVGGPHVPALGMISLGLISTYSSIAVYFHKKTSPWEDIDFYKHRTFVDDMPVW